MNKEDYEKNIGRIISGDCERAKVNFDEVMHVFSENISPEEFASLTNDISYAMSCLNQVRSNDYFDLIPDEMKKGLKGTEEEIRDKIFVSCCVTFIRIIKDNRFLLESILDKIPYPSIEVL